VTPWNFVDMYRPTNLPGFIPSSADWMSLWNSLLYSGGSRWPCGIRRGSAATRLLGLWIRNRLRTWTFVCCKCCALSGRGLCEELITHPGESYRLQYVVVCVLEPSRMRTSSSALGHSTRNINREEWGSNIGPAILRNFLCFSSVSPEKCHDSTPNQARTTSFIVYNSLNINQRNIYVVCATDSVVIKGPPQNSKHLKANIGQYPHSGTTNVRRHCRKLLCREFFTLLQYRKKKRENYSNMSSQSDIYFQEANLLESNKDTNIFLFTST